MATYNVTDTKTFDADSQSGSGNDYIYGNDLANTIYAGFGIDRVQGYGGNDRLYGGSHGDFIYGGSGDDTIEGGDESTTITGDSLYGEDGIDSIWGGNGNDRISGGNGDDAMLAGEGDNDIIQGDAGNDYLWGDIGDDVLYGDDPTGDLSITGNDYMRGGDGNDKLYGGPGNDALQGELGADTLTGGPGSDRFVFASINVSTLNITDNITDFVQGTTSTGREIIDFSSVDTNPNLSGFQHQAFSFIGTNAFANDGVARVRFFQSGTDTFVQADTGDGVVDLNIKLTGNYILTVSDFGL